MALDNNNNNNTPVHTAPLDLETKTFKDNISNTAQMTLNNNNMPAPNYWPSWSYGISGYIGVPAYGFPDPYWNPQRPYGHGPSNNPGRHGPSGPQGHSGYDGPFGPYGGGYNGPFGPPGHSGNTAATNGPQPQHQYTYEPDHAQARQSRTDIEYENRRFQRCQDTLVKAYTEKDKYTGAAEEFLMPKVTIFKHRCKRARATPDDWAELLSVMLAGKALTWYMILWRDTI
ncbi:hypothetical protein E4U09_005587 [Claviceps aff. purpurea]|uniref:Uncharacterized protein n=1 Tax=Claviceps aff. purpurea TaxID=1967640 RepID=A0A9P7U0L9_9HYPO|nr:hypothetical protein E4U09_005587 [Claviceps aff. purpurea]